MCFISKETRTTFAFVSTSARIHCLQTNTQISALDQVTREYTEAMLKIKCRLREFSYFNKKEKTNKPKNPINLLYMQMKLKISITNLKYIKNSLIKLIKKALCFCSNRWKSKRNSTSLKVSMTALICRLTQGLKNMHGDGNRQPAVFLPKVIWSHVRIKSQT